MRQDHFKNSIWDLGSPHLDPPYCWAWDTGPLSREISKSPCFVLTFNWDQDLQREMIGIDVSMQRGRNMDRRNPKHIA